MTVHYNGKYIHGLPLMLVECRSPLPGERIIFVDHHMEHPFTSKDLANETVKDRTLKEVLRGTRECWPTTTTG